MAPPELPRNAPVTNICEPIDENLAVRTLRHNENLPCFHRIDGSVGQWAHFAKPLHGYAGLDNGFTAGADAHRVGMAFYFYQQALRFQIGHHAFACFEAIETGVGAGVRVHAPFACHDVNLGKLMPPSHLEIVRVMRWRDLHGPSAEFTVDRRIRNHRDFPVHQRQEKFLADQMLVAFVLGIYRHGGIAQHRFWTRRGHDHRFA